jgi:hypothetical protein
MTGVNGRPELVIEGSDDMSSVSGWKAYHFLYKPGDITKAPKFISKTIYNLLLNKC